MPRARVIRPADRVVPEGETPGMEREEALASEGLWMGVVRTEPGVITGWHHHGEYDTYVYVLSGRAVLEYGPGGSLVEEAEAGDFLHIPRAAVHREGSARGSRGVEAVLFRVGRGQVVFNVDRPEEPEPKGSDG